MQVLGNYDKPTDQPTNGQAGGVIGKLDFQLAVFNKFQAFILQVKKTRDTLVEKIYIFLLIFKFCCNLKSCAQLTPL